MSDIEIIKPNELVDPQSQRMVDFLDSIGLPSENIIASIEDRKIIGTNISSVIQSLPKDNVEEARYLSKFVIGAAYGLFDYSLNAIWNEVVLNLRTKAEMYGIDIFFDAAVGGSKTRDFYQTASDLASLKDSTLLDTCSKLELISETTYKKLKHILDMRNNIGISHPNSYNINAFELLGWLQTCVHEVLSDTPTEAALQIQSFIQNLRKDSAPIDSGSLATITSKFHELPTHLCGNLLRTVFGIYVASDTEPTVRKNVSLIAPALWNTCKDESKYKLGVVLEGYNVNLHRDKYELGEQFFNVVQGQAFRSQSERVVLVNELIGELMDKHSGWDNFHHEPPVAAQLRAYHPDQASIIDGLAQNLFRTILTCRIGNGVAYQTGVSPGARSHYDAILSLAGDKYAPHVMASLSELNIRIRLNNSRCRTHAKQSLQLVKANVINQRIHECLDYLISNIETDILCVSNNEFKKLSAGYITWSS